LLFVNEQWVIQDKNNNFYVIPPNCTSFKFLLCFKLSHFQVQWQLYITDKNSCNCKATIILAVPISNFYRTNSFIFNTSMYNYGNIFIQYCNNQWTQLHFKSLHILIYISLQTNKQFSEAIWLPPYRTFKFFSRRLFTIITRNIQNQSLSFFQSWMNLILGYEDRFFKERNKFRDPKMFCFFVSISCRESR
jgi:hypothetical protein